MLYPSGFEAKLGFDSIREWLNKECRSTLGQSYVDQMRFVTNPGLLDALLTQAREFKDILDSGESFPSDYFYDMRSALKKARVEENYLTEDEFHHLRLFMYSIRQCTAFLNKRKQQYPALFALTENAPFNHQFYNKLNGLFDNFGKLKDDASAELKRLRGEIKEAESNLQNQVDRIIRKFRKDEWIEEDTRPTIRNHRMVIPVPSEYKRKIKGFVHDTSQTGQTIFVEPEPVIEHNNYLRELQVREQYEVVRILRGLTAEVREEMEDLLESSEFIGKLDFIRSKAKVAQQMKAVKPAFENKPDFSIYQARHPLLEKHLQEMGRELVPFDIYLNNEEHILLISGPNAGGKSVCLKSTGLIQYMFQCGLLVPVQEQSLFGVFEKIFLDIGDDQSLESDLSTYSSHLMHLKYFLQNGDSSSLILIDEFGTGTEPHMGASIAEVVLEEFVKNGCRGVLTTHYANLKNYAYHNAGLVNGAMLFNEKDLTPLYQLEIGHAGGSYALEIASKIGLPDKVINKAREKAGTDRADFDQMVRDMEREKKELSEKNKKVGDKEKRLNKIAEEYEELKQNLENKKQSILQEAREQSREMLEKAEKEVDRAMQSVKQEKPREAEKEERSKVREDLQQSRKSVERNIQQNKPASNKENGERQGPLQPGDHVVMEGQNSPGEILSVDDKSALVLMGNIRSRVALTKLKKANKKEQNNPGTNYARKKGNVQVHEKGASFQHSLDVRGWRVDEALKAIDQWMDQAIMAGANDLKILHGKGTGALRNAIRKHLKQYKQVASMEDEHVERGGAGITLIKLE